MGPTWRQLHPATTSDQGRVAAWRRVMRDAVTWCGMACAVYLLLVLSEPEPSPDCAGVSCVPDGAVLAGVGILGGIPVMAAGLLVGGGVLRLLARNVRLPRIVGTVLGLLCLTSSAVSVFSALKT